MPEKVAFRFDPFALAGVEKPKGRINEAKREIAQMVLDKVLESCAAGKSPVSGGKWKRSLSKEYRDRKLAQGGNPFADMELTGDMLDSLEVVFSGSELELRIRGKEAGKADGHNNHSGKSPLPPREFIPKQDQTFKRDIIQEIQRIAREKADG